MIPDLPAFFVSRSLATSREISLRIEFPALMVEPVRQFVTDTAPIAP
jgi:hypothetical protein